MADMSGTGSPERQSAAIRPKKAGDEITCLKCHGRGYTFEGLTGDYPVECSRCGGTGKQTVRPHR